MKHLMQTTQSIKPWLLLLAMALLIGLSLTFFIGSTAGAQGEDEAKEEETPYIVTFEIAEDGTRFSPDEGPVFEEDGMPAYGAAFVTQGYIYPEGTLTCGPAEDADETAPPVCNGVLPDGSPEFPALVLGEWSCWGYHVGDGAHTETGPIVVTTQMYSFGDEPGAEIITTAGYELADFNALVKRSVTGGTGLYRDASGEQSQELLGLNNADLPTFGVSLRITFDLTNVMDTMAE
jgi:hypothetical protein